MSARRKRELAPVLKLVREASVGPLDDCEGEIAKAAAAQYPPMDPAIARLLGIAS